MNPKSTFAVPAPVEEAKSKTTVSLGKKSHYAPISWKAYFDNLEIIGDKIPLYTAGSKGPVILCLHGAGYSALSFATFARELRPYYRLASFDFRGHGLSKEEDEDDYSIDILVKDTIKVLDYLSKKYPSISIVLLGHSMGGAVATKTVKEVFENPTLYSFCKVIKALSVIDVVEGTAISALQYMDSVIDAKPSSFNSLEEAIQWTVVSGNIRLTESARVSTPVTLIEEKTVSGNVSYKWRTDLKKTRPYWEGWFKGLSKDFMNVKVPKQLVLAGAERMDTELTIGHMQGRFKLDVITNVGHVIQEDNPKKLALTVAGFLSAFKIEENAVDGKKGIGFKLADH